MIEEILLKMGLNSTAVATGLRGVRGQLQSFASSVRSTFQGVASNIAGFIGVAAVTAQFKKVISEVEHLRNTANSLSISTDFLQDIENVGKAAGLTQQKIEAALGRFTKGLPEGSNVENAFLKLADKIKSIEDPATRARLAIEAFGRGGVELLPILQQGAAGLGEMASQFSKFSESEIVDLQKADEQLDKFGNTITIWSGKAIANIGAVSRALGRMSVEGTTQLTFWDDLARTIRANDVDEQDAADAAQIRIENLRRKLEQEEARRNRIKLDQGVGGKSPAQDILAVEKTLADVREKEYQRILKTLTAEEQINLLIRERARLIRIANDRFVSPENQAAAIKGFFDIDEQIRALQPGVPAQSVDNRSAWQKQMDTNWSLWKEAHKDTLRLPWDKTTSVVKAEETLVAKLEDIKTQLAALRDPVNPLPVRAEIPNK